MKLPPLKRTIKNTISVLPAGTQKPKRKCTRWTKEEDQKLIVAVDKFEMKWVDIAGFVGTKNPDQCNQHWHRVLDPNISKEKWTEEEEEKLINLVEESGESSWKDVSRGMQNRTDLQCRHKWIQLKKERSKKEKHEESCDYNTVYIQEATQLYHVPQQEILDANQSIFPYIAPHQECYTAFIPQYEQTYLSTHHYHPGFALTTNPHFFPSRCDTYTGENIRYNPAPQEFLPSNLYVEMPQIDFGCDDSFCKDIPDVQFNPSPVDELFDYVDLSEFLNEE
ncbi:Myb-like protein mybN [Acrasis kona]|uniref:Myb-like protein mybN n=1 Tax=Acrasis kona TaxID=1008807 RepID=A0AAW2Z848_9EUKA